MVPNISHIPGFWMGVLIGLALVSLLVILL